MTVRNVEWRPRGADRGGSVRYNVDARMTLTGQYHGCGSRGLIVPHDTVHANNEHRYRKVLRPGFAFDPGCPFDSFGDGRMIGALDYLPVPNRGIFAENDNVQWVTLSRSENKKSTPSPGWALWSKLEHNKQEEEQVQRNAPAKQEGLKGGGAICTKKCLPDEVVPCALLKQATVSSAPSSHRSFITWNISVRYIKGSRLLYTGEMLGGGGVVTVLLCRP